MSINKLSISAFRKNNNDINSDFLNGCEEKHFGIIKLHAKAINKITIPLHIILTIDVSSSMEDTCLWNNNTYSKLDYVIATLKSIFNYLKTEYKDRDILISLISFSDTASIIESYIELKNITIDNLNNLVDKLKPVGCTNIYDALKKASNLYEEFDVYLTSNEDLKNKYENKQYFKHINILLTDGEITCGLDNPIALAEIAEPKLIELQLLGYGSDHDSNLLKKLENLTDGEYRFVDSFEAAGAVYGDVLSGILHPALQNISFEMENSLIYNYKENKWDSSLTIPRIGDDCEKILSCRLFSNAKILITYTDITGENNIITNKRDILLSNENENSIIYEDSQDLRCYWLRQKTLELMNEIQRFTKDNNREEDQLVLQQRQMTPTRNNNVRGNPYIPRRVMRAQTNQNKNKNLIENVDKLLTYIDRFEIDMVRELTDKNIELLKDLKDDLNVAKKYLTNETTTNEKYLNSRIASQGGQRAYNINAFDNNFQMEIQGTQTNISHAATARQQARVSSFASPYAQRAMNHVSQLSQDFIGSQDLMEN